MSQAETNNAEPAYENPGSNILIVDDDNESIRLILEILAQKGICGDIAEDEASAIKIFDRGNCDLVFMRTQMATQATVSFRAEQEFLRKVRTDSPEMPVIVMAQPQKKQKKQQLVSAAINAIRSGCCDFLIKPLNPQKIGSLLDTFLPNHNIHNCDVVEQGANTVYRIVGKSRKLTQTVELAKKIAPTSMPVLINGSSGTGKELIALLIHHHSRRSLGPYVRVNCAALSNTLLESELFGHEKGAFTGAHAQRKGRFEMAHGGTLLLDEITETPINFQSKLLRVLEQQDFERVGGCESVKVNVRIISTTNKDLLAEVAEGRFRQDLYYRLCGVKLIVPALKDRPEDLPDLVWHFVNLNARQTQRQITRLDPAMMNIFAKYDWPGNIRQLRNVVMTSLILGVGQSLSLADVSWLFDELQPLQQREKLLVDNSELSNTDMVGLPLNAVERKAILDTLDHTSGNQSKAAKMLGISARTLRLKVRQYRQDEVVQLT
ncbi:sigma-54-dependent transcriptional regulator [Planctomycetota bacterium]